MGSCSSLMLLFYTLIVEMIRVISTTRHMWWVDILLINSFFFFFFWIGWLSYEKLFASLQRSLAREKGHLASFWERRVSKLRKKLQLLECVHWKMMKMELSNQESWENTYFHRNMHGSGSAGRRFAFVRAWGMHFVEYMGTYATILRGDTFECHGFTHEWHFLLF